MIPARTYSSAAEMQAHAASLRRSFYARRPERAEPARPIAPTIVPQPVSDLRSWLAHRRSPRGIVTSVARIYGTTYDEVQGTRRILRIVRARRHAVVELRRAFPKFSLSQIGRHVGLRNHTTVLHHLSVWRRLDTALLFFHLPPALFAVAVLSKVCQDTERRFVKSLPSHSPSPPSVVSSVLSEKHGEICECARNLCGGAR